MIQAFTPIFKTSAKIYFISKYGKEVSVNVNHSFFFVVIIIAPVPVLVVLLELVSHFVQRHQHLASIENFNPLGQMPSHADAANSVMPRSCRIEPNFAYRKLCQIYCLP